MKIIGKTEAHHLVEMTGEELALAAGYGGSYDSEWKKKFGGGTGYGGSGAPVVPIGTVVDVKAVHSFIRDMEGKEGTVRQAAKTLEALALLITSNLPSVVLVPTPQQEPDTNGHDSAAR